MSLRALAALAGFLVLTCRPPASQPVPVLPYRSDSLRYEVIAPGVNRWYFHVPAGPWAIHVLDVRLEHCYSARAVKGAPGAAGREKTSALLAGLARTHEVIGGVNADFFLFAPPGVPTGAHISEGSVVTGPSSQPVFVIDSAGRPGITRLRLQAEAAIGGRRHAVTGWNRATANGLALFDERWGPALDTASAVVEVVLRGDVVLAVDTLPAGSSLPPGGKVLVAGRAAGPGLRRELLELNRGDRVTVRAGLMPWPLEAVGGRPVLLRDSAVTPEVDTEGQPGFATGRHPRTAVGIGGGGTRLLLVVVDGRQRPYSDGMSLRELANLLQALGARDALNLDGGGSSALVYADPRDGNRLRLANRPSDPLGERAVGNALAVVRSACR